MAISAPALPGSAEAVRQAGRKDVNVIGLSLPNINKPYVHDGVVQTVVLWNTRDLGYLAVYASALVTAEQAGAGRADASRPAGWARSRSAAARSFSARRCCSIAPTSIGSISSRGHGAATESHMTRESTDAAYVLARQRYADLGVDTDAALQAASRRRHLAPLLAGRRCRRIRGAGRQAGRRPGGDRQLSRQGADARRAPARRGEGAVAHSRDPSLQPARLLRRVRGPPRGP